MPKRVSQVSVEQVASELSDRDKDILADVERVRVLTGGQLERLHFHELEGDHRDRTRRRVLSRLATSAILTTLERRIGGARAGSSGLVYTLDRLGQRVMTLLHNADAVHEPRPRRPAEPTERFLGHCLAISELYVQLSEQERQHGFRLRYYAEPDSWWPDSNGDWVKPDAYAVLETELVRDRWSIEVDRATESLPTVRRKLTAYLDLAERNESGPGGGVLPKVLVTVPDQRRQDTVTEAVGQLREPASQLFAVVQHNLAASYLAQQLHT